MPRISKRPARGHKRGVVTYVRLPPEAHAQIVDIASQRGWPHTIASVAAEMISRGLAVEKTP